MVCIDYNNKDANDIMFRNEKYIETRDPYAGWTIYPPVIKDAENQEYPNPNKVFIRMYNSRNQAFISVTLPRFVMELHLGNRTDSKNTGDIRFKDGNCKNLDISNMSFSRELTPGLFPYNDYYINFNHKYYGKKPEIGLIDIKTKRSAGHILEERYWLSVKLGRKITTFEGYVIHKDGNIMNNDMDNLELKPSNCIMGEGIYSDCKIEKKFNKPRGRWMVTIYRRNPDTGFWDRVEGKAYARYLMEVKLGKMLPKDIEVDHINGDRSDDRIDNLQLVSPEENKFKATYTGENRVSTADEIEYRCRNCGKIVRMRLWKFDTNSPSNSSFCGRECKFEYMRKRGLNSEETLGVSPDIIRYIKVPTISKEIMERTSDEIKQRVMSTCEAAKEYTTGYGMGFYIMPTLIPTNQFFALSVNPLLIPKVVQDPDLNKEYVFNSLPVTPFDV
jgi:hypothetical protein